MTTLPPSLTNQEAPAGRPPGLPVENRELERNSNLRRWRSHELRQCPTGADHTEKMARGTDRATLARSQAVEGKCRSGHAGSPRTQYPREISARADSLLVHMLGLLLCDPEYRLADGIVADDLLDLW